MTRQDVISPDRPSHAHALSWINRLLKTNFKDVRQIGSGACHCQVMDCVFPGSLDMSKVKFDAQSQEDYEHNFHLLRDAFRKKKIERNIPDKELMNGNEKLSLEFLKWFKSLYNEHVEDNNYDPVKARSNQEIRPMKISHLSYTETNGTETPGRGHLYSEEWMEEFSWAEPSDLGEQYTYCSSCQSNLKTINNGLVELVRHAETNKHKKRAQLHGGGSRESLVPELPACSEAAVRFIYSRCRSGSAKSQRALKQFVDCKLGSNYPKDIISVCQNTPYCIYVYEEVEAGEETVAVVLVGYFDVKKSCHFIRFLDVVQSDDVPESQKAAAVVQTLKRFQLSTENLAVAVCLSKNVQTSEQIFSHLKELNPNVIDFGALYSIADAAFHAGMKELSKNIQGFLTDLHAHFCSTETDKLKALFSLVLKAHRKPFYLHTSCLNFCSFVTKLLEIWTDLTDYFSSHQEEEKRAKIINLHLKNPKVKATFMFLEQALKPLQDFQKQIQEGCWANMPLVLEKASALLETYTAWFLTHNAALRYLHELDVQILKNRKFHHPSHTVNIGGKAVEDFLRTAEDEEARQSLQKEVTPFYIALTSCIADELPLSHRVLKSMAHLLNPNYRIKVPKKSVEELASDLAVCSSAKEVAELTEGFTRYLAAEEKQSPEERNGGSLEQHWAQALRSTETSSLFRKLILTLLSFSCPPLDMQHILTQAFNKDPTTASESVGLTESGRRTTSITVTKSDLQVHFRARNGFDVVMRPCDVRLIKIDDFCEDLLKVNKTSPQEGAIRGGSGRDNALRQRPQARKVFQAGVSTWAKPINLEKDSQNDEQPIDEVSDDDSPSTTPARGARYRCKDYMDGRGFLNSELVWAKVKGFSWWPGMVVPWRTTSLPPAMRRLELFGDGLFIEISTEKLMPFSAFNKCFCRNSLSLPAYKKAIYQILELVSERCEKSFSDAGNDKEKELQLMVEWALEGFLPTGPRGFAPIDFFPQDDSPESSPEYQPPHKRKYSIKSRMISTPIVYNKEAILEKMKSKGSSIKDLCLSCGSSNVDVQHPLFEGGLCGKCKLNFSETLYRYDDDGYQSYCTVCCAGQEVILCGNPSCCRCFCKDCLDILVAPETFDKLKDVDPWHCYMCEPSKCSGYLRVRENWSVHVQDFFANNSAMAFEPHRIYPAVPTDQRKPIKVLSLFDGIATGYLVLKDLGFKIERYLASEICDDSIAVGMIKHEGRIEYVKDVRSITRKHLAEWGPFDLLIGGSPCNDLATVNPNRKGLFEGTGRLFFEYYRILTLLKPREEDDRPFFWLFENVVHMDSRDKEDICRFLECNPILIDAVKVTPAHRARYFWGNIPGMNRPLATSLNEKVNLQSCLEIGRIAKFDKVRTITTKGNCHRQGKDGLLPVSMNGKDDYLWCTEMELIFGFPKHYTDVNNMSRMHRQRVLGRSWSVPVIRHLLAPLKDYFLCE